MTMLKRFLLTAAFVLAAGHAEAGPIRSVVRSFAPRTQTIRTQQSVQTTQSYQTTATDRTTSSFDHSSSIQAKADVQARQGRMFHPGGGFVAEAVFEGVGFSSVSAGHALSVTCNNGGRVLAAAVSRGVNGWYAVRQFGPR
jgi:hypothetical protein